MNSCISDRLMFQLYVYGFSVYQGFKYIRCSNQAVDTVYGDSCFFQRIKG